MPTSARLIADLGAGTGSLPGRGPAASGRAAQGLAFDVSKPALRRAARAHERMGAILADTWGPLPLADDGVDVLLNVFAPRNGPEMRRVLCPARGPDRGDARRRRTWRELREAAGLLEVDPSKQERLDATLHGFDRLAERDRSRWRLDLTAAQAEQPDPDGAQRFSPLRPDRARCRDARRGDRSLRGQVDLFPAARRIVVRPGEDRRPTPAPTAAGRSRWRRCRRAAVVAVQLQVGPVQAVVQVQRGRHHGGIARRRQRAPLPGAKDSSASRSGNELDQLLRRPAAGRAL